MATQTQYYNLDKPSYGEVADIEVINANMDKIDQQMRNNADGVNFAKDISSDAYDNSKSYAVGDYCIYNNKLYRCITAIESAEAFNIAKWEQTTVGNEVSQLNSNLSDFGLDNKCVEIVQGSIRNNGTDTEDENRVKTKDYLYVSSGNIVTVKTSLLIAYAVWDENKTYVIYSSEWLSNDIAYEATQNCYVRIKFKKSDDSNFTPSQAGHVGVYINNAIDELKNDLGGLSFSVSGTTLSITDGTNTWTLQ